MAWVRFLEPFDDVPPEAPRVMIAYKAGTVANVPRRVADRACKLAKAVRTGPPRRKREDDGG